MGLGPRHDKQRKGRCHQAIGKVDRPAGQPRIMPPFLKRAKNGVQKSRGQRKPKRRLVPRCGSIWLIHSVMTPNLYAASLRVQPHQGIRKLLRVKRLQIINLFAHADGMDRQPELIRKRHQHTALGRAIQLGHDQTGNI